MNFNLVLLTCREYICGCAIAAVTLCNRSQRQEKAENHRAEHALSFVLLFKTITTSVPWISVLSPSLKISRRNNYHPNSSTWGRGLTIIGGSVGGNEVVLFVTDIFRMLSLCWKIVNFILWTVSLFASLAPSQFINVSSGLLVLTFNHLKLNLLRGNIK